MLIKQVTIGSNLGYSNHILFQFVILGNMDLANSKVRTLKYRRAKFQLFKDLVDENPGTLSLGTKELIRAGNSMLLKWPPVVLGEV